MPGFESLQSCVVVVNEELSLVILRMTLLGHSWCLLGCGAVERGVRETSEPTVFLENIEQ